MNSPADAHRRPSVPRRRWNPPPLNAGGKTSRTGLEIIAGPKSHRRVGRALSPHSGLVNRCNARFPMSPLWNGVPGVMTYRTK